MKLLLDHNLSFRLSASLAELYPGTSSARDLGLARASDGEVWRFAVLNRFSIVSKDSDFRQRSFLQGPPPKVIWIATGNCSTNRILRLLQDRQGDILKFEADTSAALLVLR